MNKEKLEQFEEIAQKAQHITAMVKAEEEKMLAEMTSGELYDANNEFFCHKRALAKDLCFELNNKTKPSDEKRIDQLVRKIIGKCGKNCFITPPFYCDYGFNITLGDNFYSNHNLVVLDGGKVTIGDNVFIAPNCGIYTAGHPLDYKTRNTYLEYGKPITIGDNVWIGGNVVICPGVTIGSGSVIGAGSVVCKDIPENVLAVGNPCKPIKTINQD